LERRSDARYALWLPVRVDALEEGVAVSHNISTRGLLLVTASTVAIGAPISVTFRIPADAPHERTVIGHVIRVERNEADPLGLWPHRMAIQFDEPVPELEPMLEEAESPVSIRPGT
jgi:hypothetical protein